MALVSHAVELLASGVIRLGPLRLSAYGLCAAAGLVAALWLSLRTSKLTALDPAALWDAGLFGLFAAFVLSRALLVVRNWAAFLHYPMLVLALPSFTYGAMALTAAALLVYLRWKRLPILAVLDAWAPSAALLAAFLELGHWAEGSDAGMPWGPHSRLLPTQLLGAAAALALMLALLWLLSRRRPGIIGGLGLLLGGFFAFLLDLVTQPAMEAGNPWLETGQWIALAAMIVGAVVLQTAKEQV